MLELRSSDTLDGGDFGWLKAKHHFRASRDGNPNHNPIGPLVIWNDDQVAPGTGFALHAHRDIEIISYVSDGFVTHRDSIGNISGIEAGDVQVISAGTGIHHSEYNLGTEPLRLFQIWLEPREAGGAPSWETRKFPKSNRANQFTVLASGFAHDTAALPIRSDARVLGATLFAGNRIEYDLGDLKNAYLAPAKGVVRANGKRLLRGDGLALKSEARLTVEAEEACEIILVMVA